jgi:pimeloyl-ACP methyl ester carboxylesterase
MDDVRAVMDAAHCEKGAIVGLSEGGPMALLFAATYPECVTALVLWGTFARLTWALITLTASTPRQVSSSAIRSSRAGVTEGLCL